MDGKNLSCSLCKRSYTKEERRPRALLCGHTFCTLCLDEAISNKVCNCPDCNQPFIALTAMQLPTDFSILRRLTSLSSATPYRSPLTRISSDETDNSLFKHFPKESLTPTVNQGAEATKHITGSVVNNGPVITRPSYSTEDRTKIRRYSGEDKESTGERIVKSDSCEHTDKNKHYSDSYSDQNTGRSTSLDLTSSSLSKNSKMESVVKDTSQANSIEGTTTTGISFDQSNTLGSKYLRKDADSNGMSLSKGKSLGKLAPKMELDSGISTASRISPSTPSHVLKMCRSLTSKHRSHGRDNHSTNATQQTPLGSTTESYEPPLETSTAPNPPKQLGVRDAEASRSVAKETGDPSDLSEIRHSQYRSEINRKFSSMEKKTRYAENSESRRLSRNDTGGGSRRIALARNAVSLHSMSTTDDSDGSEGNPSDTRMSNPTYTPFVSSSDVRTRNRSSESRENSRNSREIDTSKEIQSRRHLSSATLYTKRSEYYKPTKNYRNDEEYKLIDTHDDEYKPKETYDEDYKPRKPYDEDHKPRVTCDEDYKPKKTYNEDLKPRETYDEDHKPRETLNEDCKPKKTYDEDYKPKKTYDEDYKSKETYDEDYKPKKTYDEDYKPKKTYDEDYKPKKTYDEDYKPKKTYDEDYKPKKTYDEHYKLRKTYDEDYKPTKTDNEDYKSKKTRDEDYKPKETYDEDYEQKKTYGEDYRPKKTYREEIKPKKIYEEDYKVKRAYDQGIKVKETYEDDGRPEETYNEDNNPKETYYKDHQVKKTYDEGHKTNNTHKSLEETKERNDGFTRKKRSENRNIGNKFKSFDYPRPFSSLSKAGLEPNVYPTNSPVQDWKIPRKLSYNKQSGNEEVTLNTEEEARQNDASSHSSVRKSYSNPERSRMGLFRLGIVSSNPSDGDERKDSPENGACDAVDAPTNDNIRQEMGQKGKPLSEDTVESMSRHTAGKRDARRRRKEFADPSHIKGGDSLIYNNENRGKPKSSFSDDVPSFREEGKGSEIQKSIRDTFDTKYNCERQSSPEPDRKQSTHEGKHRSSRREKSVPKNIQRASSPNEVKKTFEVPINPDHATEVLRQLPESGICRTHGSMVKLYCQRCEVWICEECLDILHPSPPRGQCCVVSASEALLGLKDEHSEFFSSRINTLNNFRHDLQKLVRDCDNSIREHEAKIVNLKAKMQEEETLLKGLRTMKTLVMQKWQQVDKWEDILQNNAERIEKSSSSQEMMHAVRKNEEDILRRLREGDVLEIEYV